MGVSLVRKDEPVTQYRMTALSDYSNGAIAWPEGMAAFWPKGQERIVPGNIWDRIMRDGVAQFSVTFYTPPEPPQPEPTEPAAPDKRVAALAKARAAKAAKQAAAQADKD